MARIDFHSNVGDKLDYVCRLTRKIWSATLEGQAVRPIVIVANKTDLKQLNDLLWTFSKTDFLPQCFIDHESAAETPIVLTEDCSTNSLKAIPHADILIQIGQQMPNDVAALVERFPRIVEVVTTNEAERLAGRNRFKTYRDLGLELHNFDQTKS